MNHRRANFFDGPPSEHHKDQPNSEARVIEFGTPAIPDQYVAYAKRIKASRILRLTFFDSSLFGEPAWDMMLALYIAQGEGRRVKVSDLYNESGVPATTTLRWVNRLFELGMTRKRRHRTDLRISFVEIHPDTIRKMNAYFELALKRHFLPM